MTALAHRIDRRLREAVASDRIPGVVALVHRDGYPPYQGAFGHRDRATNAPMRVDTVFWIASMTKAVTSVAAMQLVEQGRIGLDEPLGRILPDLAAPKILIGFDAAGEPVLRAASTPITLRHLLTHTSGFTEDVWEADLARYAERTGLPSTRTGRRAALVQPLLFEPGQSWQYGVSHDWVGLLIEAVSGQTLDRYLSQYIFRPLGMADTGYIPDTSRVATVYRREAHDRLHPVTREIPATREYMPGGGSLFSTGPDYLRFLRMLLDGGRADGVTILRPETVATMRRNHIGDHQSGTLRSARPDLSNDVEFFPGLRKGWGLGFMVMMEPVPNGRGAGSISWAGLGNTYFWCDPAAGIAALLMTQILPFADRAAMDLVAAFEGEIYAPSAGD